MLVLCPTGAATIEADERGFSPPPRRPAGTPSTPAKRQATAGADSDGPSSGAAPACSQQPAAKLCLPLGCDCAGGALPGDPLECAECEKDTRTGGVSGTTGCEQCTKAIAKRAEELYADDVAPLPSEGVGSKIRAHLLTCPPTKSLRRRTMITQLRHTVYRTARAAPALALQHASHHKKRL